MSNPYYFPHVTFSWRPRCWVSKQIEAISKKSERLELHLPTHPLHLRPHAPSSCGYCGYYAGHLQLGLHHVHFPPPYHSHYYAKLTGFGFCFACLQTITHTNKTQRKNLVVSFSPIADIPPCDLLGFKWNYPIVLLLFTYLLQSDTHPTKQYHNQKADLCIGVAVGLRAWERSLTKVLTSENPHKQ